MSRAADEGMYRFGWLFPSSLSAKLQMLISRRDRLGILMRRRERGGAACHSWSRTRRCEGDKPEANNAKLRTRACRFDHPQSISRGWSVSRGSVGGGGGMESAYRTIRRSTITGPVDRIWCWPRSKFGPASCSGRSFCLVLGGRVGDTR